jgi:hypothetical protein
MTIPADACYHDKPSDGHCCFIRCLNYAGGFNSQAMFEALFPKGYTPKIDVRTPRDVADQAKRERWR